MCEEEFESLERKEHNNFIRLQKEYERMEYEYDRNPGAFPIGTLCTDEADADLTNHKQHASEQFYYVGDSALLASSYSGEGISFAIESGVEAAKSIVADIGD